MREDVAFILRHFVRDLPWLLTSLVVIGGGFAMGPMISGDATAGDALEVGVGMGIGLTAFLPVARLRPSTIRKLGGRRTVIAVGMAVAWAAVVLLAAWPLLTSLDAGPFGE